MKLRPQVTLPQALSFFYNVAIFSDNEFQHIPIFISYEFKCETALFVVKETFGLRE